MTATALQQAGHGAATEGPDLGATLMHHIADAPEIEFPPGIPTWHLPEWEPLHLGPLTLDVSPTKHAVFLLVAAVLCAAVFLMVGAAARNRDASRAPTGFANAIEALVLYFREDVVRQNIGKGADKYTSYILTLFFFILAMNLLGLVPWGSSATGNISVTAALAVVTLVVVEVSGFRALGPAGYARTIFFLPPGLPGWLKPIMLLVMIPVEFIGKLSKPFALAIRLFANMTAGTYPHSLDPGPHLRFREHDVREMGDRGGFGRHIRRADGAGVVRGVSAGLHLRHAHGRLHRPDPPTPTDGAHARRF